MGRPIRTSTTIARRFLSAGLLVASLLIGHGACAESYSYDSLGRLVTVVSDSGFLTTFTYDAAGNRTQTNTAAGSAAPPAPADLAVTANASPQTTAINPLAGTSGLTLTGASQPLYGAANVSGSTITYTRPAGMTGAVDVLTYSVQNGAGLTGSATIRVTL
jgi:YD repeat-containing protein